MNKIAKNLNLLSRKIQNLVQISSEIFENQIVQKRYIELIQTRLYDKGVDSDNKELQTDTSKIRAGNRSNYYSDTTVFIKGQKGQKASNVTLKDTGSFYNSMYIDIQKQFYEVKANFKDIFDNFELSYSGSKDFEDAILNLTEQEFDYFISSTFLLILQNKIKELINEL